MKTLLMYRLMIFTPFALLLGVRVIAAIQIGLSDGFEPLFLDAQNILIKLFAAPSLSLLPPWTESGGIVGPYSGVSLPVAIIRGLTFVIFSMTGLGFAGPLFFLIIADILPVYFLRKATKGTNRFPAALIIYGFSTTPFLLALGADYSGSILLASVAALVLSLSARKLGWASISYVALLATDPVLAILLGPSLAVLVARMRPTFRIWVMCLTAILFCAWITLVPLSSNSRSSQFIFDGTPWRFVTDAAVDLGFGSISLTLTVIVLSVFMFTKIRRVNLHTLTLGATAPLFLICLIPGSPIAWSLVALPLLIVVVLRLQTGQAVIGITALSSPGLLLAIKALAGEASVKVDGGLLVVSQSLAMLIGVLAVVFVWTSEITNSDFLRLRSRPALVLVAGDSGVGKDTLAEGLSRSLGQATTTLVSGDDYHVWDRGKASWNFVTHLNPSANELSKFARDVIRLTEGRSIEKGTYDHRLGRRSSPGTSKSREFVIATGLHALWARDLNRLAALKVFISMSDELRTFLKTKRDSGQRGYSKSDVLEVLGRRKIDSENFIAPQSGEADLSIHVEAESSSSLALSIETKLYFSSKPMLFDEQLVSELSTTCGLEVMWESDGANRVISVSGNCDLDSLRHAFARLEPEVSLVLGPGIGFDDGGAGVIQMVVLVYLVSSLRLERLI